MYLLPAHLMTKTDPVSETCSLEYRTWTKYRPHCYTPSSEPSRVFSFISIVFLLSYSFNIIFLWYIYILLITVPRGLKPELPSLARALGSWIRIPLKAWMSVCVYSVFVLSCVVAALRWADSPFKRSYQLRIRSRN
jgi:hypothetical protein